MTKIVFPMVIPVCCCIVYLFFMLAFNILSPHTKTDVLQQEIKQKVVTKEVLKILFANITMVIRYLDQKVFQQVSNVCFHCDPKQIRAYTCHVCCLKYISRTNKMNILAKEKNKQQALSYYFLYKISKSMQHFISLSLSLSIYVCVL